MRRAVRLPSRNLVFPYGRRSRPPPHSRRALMAVITLRPTPTPYPLFNFSKSSTKGVRARPLPAASREALRDEPAKCRGFDLTGGFRRYFPPLDDAVFLSSSLLCNSTSSSYVIFSLCFPFLWFRTASPFHSPTLLIICPSFPAHQPLFASCPPHLSGSQGDNFSAKSLPSQPPPV